VLSRHADATYWTGRYIERAECTARMIDVHYHFGLESPLVGEALRWSSLIAISGQEDMFREHYDTEDERSILDFFAFDERNPSSIYRCLLEARENSRSIRDQISSEMWTCVNRTFLEYREWDVDRVLNGSPFTFFEMVKERSQFFQGVTNRTLMMGEARDFHDAGRFLERADQTARILDVKYHDLLPDFAVAASGKISKVTPAGSAGNVGGPVDIHGWNAVLRSVGAREAYNKTYREGVTPSKVAEFLILNPKFPASVRHSIGRVEGCLRRVSGNRDLAPVNDAEREVGRLYNELNYASAKEIVVNGLHEFLEELQESCQAVGDAIFRTYLNF
jgi:uncharacterized alpha-E superfamily protein